MAKDREIRTEPSSWPWESDREVIYEDGNRVGEFRTEERGAFLFFPGESVRVEYNNAGTEVAYERTESRGGFVGIGEHDVSVRYDATTKKEIGYSQVETRGGVVGIASHHVRVGYEPDGAEVSQTRSEVRGGLFGLFGARRRVTKVSAPTQSRRPTPPAPSSAGLSSSIGRHSTGGSYGATSALAGWGTEPSGFAGVRKRLLGWRGWILLGVLLTLIAHGDITSPWQLLARIFPAGQPEWERTSFTSLFHEIELEAGKQSPPLDRRFTAGYGTSHCLKWTSTAGPNSATFLYGRRTSRDGTTWTSHGPFISTAPVLFRGGAEGARLGFRMTSYRDAKVVAGFDTFRDLELECGYQTNLP